MATSQYSIPEELQPVEIAHNRIDMTNQQFGLLTVLAYSHTSAKKAYWHCVCVCGSRPIIAGANLRSGNTLSCGCSHVTNLVGQRFGHLLVEKFSHIAERKAWWECRCDCGQVCIVHRQHLVCGDRTSCGCHRYDRAGLRKDLTGQHFGQLSVTHTFWIAGIRYVTASCDCGNVWEGPSSRVLGGNTRSCGCLVATRRRDYTGQRFGKLLVQKVYWKRGRGFAIALCDCLQTWEGPTRSLVCGTTTSCGCLRSRSEQYTRERQRLQNQLRKARKNNLPAVFSQDDLSFLFQYWNFQCAICEREEGGLFHLIALDHWIPLANPACPGTVPWNILGLCNIRKKVGKSVGAPCCNNSKGSKNPTLWLTEFFTLRYGPSRGVRLAQRKLREIETYFTLVRERSVACLAS